MAQERQRNGRDSATRFCIVDAQSVKYTDTARKKGYDAGKKVSGIKRHIAVDTQGLPHAIWVTTAEVTDRAGALAMFDRHKSSLLKVSNVLADGGYAGAPFADGSRSDWAQRLKSPSAMMHTFAVMPKRGVVERSFAWLEKCRQLWKNCEWKLETSLLFAALAFLALLLRRY